MEGAGTEVAGVEVAGLTVTVQSTASTGCRGVAGAEIDDDDDDDRGSAGRAGLQYLGNGYYRWNWKVPQADAGSCRELTLVPTMAGYAFGPTELRATFDITRKNARRRPSRDH